MRRREFIAGLGGVERFQHRLRDLYEGQAPESHRFRYGLLILDLTTLAFIVATSFTPRHRLIEVLDVAFGLIFLADFCARLFISRHWLRDLLNPLTWAAARSEEHTS